MMTKEKDEINQREKVPILKINTEDKIILVLFLLNLVLISPLLFPTLNTINPHDEASYINSGRELVEGRFSSLASSPLASFLYAPLYLIFKSRINWFFLITSFGRVILFTLLWFSGFKVGKSTSIKDMKLIIPGLMLVSPIFTNLIVNPSDALFTAMSGFVLAEIIRFVSDANTAHLRYASVFLGLASLARSDGLVLFALCLLLMFAMLLYLRKPVKWLISGLLPGVFLIGIYILITGMHSGNYSLGTTQRMYHAFLQGQFVLAETPERSWIEGEEEAVELFGSAEENNYSVLRAIGRNPSAYILRLQASIQSLPNGILTVYGKRIGVPVFTLAIAGMIYLYRSKRRMELMMLLAWPSTLVVYFLTFFRDGYLLFPSIVVITLAGYGIYGLLKDQKGIVVPLGWLSVSAVIVLLSILLNKLAITTGMTMFFFFGLILLMFSFNNHENPIPLPTKYLLLLLTAVLIHGQFPFPNYRSSKLHPFEESLEFLALELDPGETLASWAPFPAWASKLSHIQLINAFEENATEDDFLSWINQKGVQAIFVDPALRANEPHAWKLIKSQIGISLDEVFLRDPGSYQILIKK
jgi:hypothetical protein